MKRSFITAAILAALSVTSLTASDEHRRGYEGLGGAFKSIDLSDEQKEKLKALRTNRANAFKNAERTEVKTDFAAVFKADSFDRSAFVAAASARASADIERRADLLAEIHAILSPEQREAFAKRLEKTAIGDRGGFGACGNKPRGDDKR
ncbi:MAG: Spy/CpxP family protein refolding chaperone [Helicobacteraceae bacterium]|jgi:Spy/CpxP family protein refolding chaperone|nr:Spy/CpxP family protein refolding chaperone [Helicobacteraceae bacterium]